MVHSGEKSKNKTLPTIHKAFMPDKKQKESSYRPKNKIL
jgi:hypothetical protein